MGSGRRWWQELESDHPAWAFAYAGAWLGGIVSVAWLAYRWATELSTSGSLGNPAALLFSVNGGLTALTLGAVPALLGLGIAVYASRKSPS